MAGTVNGLVEFIARRIRELGRMNLPTLRMEHPDSQYGAMPPSIKVMDRGQLMYDIICDEFIEETDSRIDETTLI